MFTWSVVLRVDDSETFYSSVQGNHPEAVFTGSKRECLKYIKDVSSD
jgi:hypothetical protein